MTKDQFEKRWRELDLKYIDSLLKESKKLLFSRFDQQKDVDGRTKFNNAPLKKSTVRERGSSSPILKRTGKLKTSINFKNDGRGRITIDSDLEYAQDLNDGRHSGFWGRNKDGSPKKIKPAPPSNILMKPRKFLDFPKEIRLKTGSIRQKLLKKLEQEKAELTDLYIKSL